MRRLSIRQLQARLSEVLRRLPQDGPVIVTFHGRTRAALIPLDEDRVDDLALAWASGRLPPRGLTPTVRMVLKQVRDELERLYGDRLDGLYVYGSYARGEATEESDVDLLVVLKGSVRPYEEIRRMSPVLSRIHIDTGTFVSVVVVSRTEYERGQWPVIIRAREEGIPV